jgi:hypothetical protein
MLACLLVAALGLRLTVAANPASACASGSIEDLALSTKRKAILNNSTSLGAPNRVIRTARG